MNEEEQFFGDTLAKEIVRTIRLTRKDARRQVKKELIEKIGKMRHYDLEEFDHDSKAMSVGYNKCLEDIKKLI